MEDLFVWSFFKGLQKGMILGFCIWKY